MVRLEKINKSFSSVQVLKDISVTFEAGEVHVLLGENGAGKSTLMKILSGIYEPDFGIIDINGKHFERLTPHESLTNGVCIIHQELSVVDKISVQENIFMGILPNSFGVVDYKKLEQKSRELLEKLHLSISPFEKVENLKIAEKQMVEIAKILALDAEVIIMDEPTTSLTSQEIKHLFKVIETLKEKGKHIIYISHRLEEIQEIGDKVTVLRDGEFITTEVLNKSTQQDLKVQMQQLVTKMVGREVTNEKILSSHQLYKDTSSLIVNNWTREDGRSKDISLSLNKGEIFGLAGLVGAGRTEFVESIFGLARSSSGSMELFNKFLSINSSYQAIKNDMALLSENRRESGIFQNFTVAENINFIRSIKNSNFNGLTGTINHNEERSLAEHFKKIMNIKCASIDQNITQLSGGNQQKALIARWLAAQSKFFIFDEPTKGIDVGSKQEIYQIMRQLADDGIGVLIVSSDLVELMTVCDRIGVFKESVLKGVLVNNDDLKESDIMKLAVS